MKLEGIYEIFETDSEGNGVDKNTTRHYVLYDSQLNIIS